MLYNNAGGSQKSTQQQKLPSPLKISQLQCWGDYVGGRLSAVFPEKQTLGDEGGDLALKEKEEDDDVLVEEDQDKTGFFFPLGFFHLTSV